MEPELMAVGALELRERDGRRKHYLSQRPVSGGDVIEVCFSGGWVAMRYEWDSGNEHPRFHYSVELGGGRVYESHLELPAEALLRWPR
jgi:hypothetical protein